MWKWLKFYNFGHPLLKCQFYLGIKANTVYPFIFFLLGQSHILEVLQCTASKCEHINLPANCSTLMSGDLWQGTDGLALLLPYVGWMLNTVVPRPLCMVLVCTTDFMRTQYTNNYHIVWLCSIRCLTRTQRCLALWRASQGNKHKKPRAMGNGAVIVATPLLIGLPIVVWNVSVKHRLILSASKYEVFSSHIKS